MVNRGGAQTVTPGTSNKTLNAGYYSGNITIAGDADLKAANIVSGKNIFGVAGSAKISKSYISGAQTITKYNPDMDTNGWSYVPLLTVNHNLGVVPNLIIIRFSSIKMAGVGTHGVLNVVARGGTETSITITVRNSNASMYCILNITSITSTSFTLTACSENVGTAYGDYDNVFNISEIICTSL
jgi:hypothetical protein